MRRAPRILPRSLAFGPPGSSRRSAWGVAGVVLSGLVFAGDGVWGLVTDGLTLRVWRAAGFAVMAAIGGAHVNAERLRRRRREREAAGRCVSCGYDLCATPKQCPECGRVPRVTV